MSHISWYNDLAVRNNLRHYLIQCCMLLLDSHQALKRD